ncbi:MAG: hypothetical protein HYV06_08870 [Deltaproteobacteria bacterium]|nr:hypothetical protein [Deltaproteobacteria bacterium]
MRNFDIVGNLKRLASLLATSIITLAFAMVTSVGAVPPDKKHGVAVKNKIEKLEKEKAKEMKEAEEEEAEEAEEAEVPELEEIDSGLFIRQLINKGR